MKLKLNHDGWPFVPPKMDGRIPSNCTPFTDEDFQILVDRMPASVWSEYIVADATDLSGMLKAELDIRDGGMSGFTKVSESVRFNIWKDCVATADYFDTYSIY